MSLYGNGCRLSANDVSADLSGTAAALFGSRSTSSAIMDSKYRPSVADQSRTFVTTRTEQNEESSSDASKDDVVATKEVEYIKSFAVFGDDQAQKTEYVRKYLLEAESNKVKTKLVQLVISLSGIKVSDVTGQKTLMAHALKRIAFATCFPDQRQFSFIAREPKSSTDDQFCHAFRTRSAHEAQQLNMLVAGAFRTAYAHSQSPSMSTRQLSRTAIDTQPSAVSDDLSHVDELSADDRRRQRRAAEMRQQSSDVTTNTKLLSADRPAVSHRAKSESPPSAMSAASVPSICNVVHRTATAPVFNDTNNTPSATAQPRTTQTQPWTTHVTTTATASVPVSAACSDAALMSTLLRALRNYSGTTSSASHGSPVMLLKDLIDRHFSEAAVTSLSSPGTGSPVNRLNIASDLPLPSSRVDVSGTSTTRPRPQSDVFVSNGDVDVTCDMLPNSALRSTDANSPGEDLHDAAWYQPGLPRETVLDQLALQDVGSFVVRDSTTHVGCYALSIRVDKHDAADQGISHYLITRTPRGNVRLKGMSKEWTSLTALVTHHTVMRELLPCLLILPTNTATTNDTGLERAASQCH